MNDAPIAVKPLALPQTEQEQSLFIDRADLMKRSAQNFNDPFRFTNIGCHEFTEHLLRALLPMVDGDD